MVEGPREIASHIIQPGMVAVRLQGGPWDGKEVGVRNPQAVLVAVHGPRNGDNRVWITHVYERHGACYEFVTTESSFVGARAGGPYADWSKQT
jgi:hypothetical protein